MIRKRITALLLTGVLLGGTAFGMEINMTDLENERLQISGEAKNDTLIQMMILEATNVTENTKVDVDEDDVTYFRVRRAANNAYVFDVDMPSDAEGQYYFVLQREGEEPETLYQYYYSYAKKLEYAKKLNKEEITKELTEEAMRRYSLENYMPYVQAGSEKTAQKLAAVVAKLSDFSSDAKTAYSTLKFAATAAALENSCACMSNTNGVLQYADILGIQDNVLYAEYPASLSATGVAAVNKAVADANILSAQEGAEAFEQAMLLHLIKSYKISGSGHVGDYLNTYSSLYTTYGFNLSLLNGVSDLNAVYTELKTSSATSIQTLASELPSIVENVKQGNTLTNSGKPSSLGGGGGSGGSVSRNDTNFVTPNGDETGSTLRFSDLESVPWAQEAIGILSERGVISGKGNGLFAPNDDVTRQEFVKMLVGAFALQAEDTACKFEDVSADWAKQSVAIAAALEIVNGMSETAFAPEEKITREDGAVMLARTATVLGSGLEEGTSRFADDAQIADYAKASVYGLSNAGVIAGKGDNLFAPKATMTRAEAAKLIYGLSIMR